MIERFEKNPILAPESSHSWEAEAVFNGCPIKVGRNIYLLYRAISLPHYHTSAQMVLRVSDVGIAESLNGIDFYNRRRFIVSEEEWERFGCEDPRITKLGKNYYIFYTALGSWPPQASSIRVGVAISENLRSVKEKHLVTPFNAKAMALFPEKIKGKVWAILTVNTDLPPAEICIRVLDKEEDLWNLELWENWYQRFQDFALPLRRNPQDHIEVGSPPLKTPEGWLLFYSYIKDYFSPQRLFTVEAVLLDLENPFKIVGRTEFPLMYPQEYYERHGMVPNVIFPSGALIKEGVVYLYYGAADTTCCLAKIDLNELLQKLKIKARRFYLKRVKEEPILEPIKDHPWESKAVFNPGAIYLRNKVYLVYRAMSEDNTSVFGLAESSDGINIDLRLPKPIYVPREPFEQKLVEGANSGVEDPRLTKIGDKIYMLYTAFDGKNPPRVALTWIREKDFINHNWNWAKPKLISPPDIDDKDAALFPAKIKGCYVIIHRGGTDIDLSFQRDLEFENTWLEETRWILPRPGWWDSWKVGIASPPLRTSYGWLILYHGVSAEDHKYRVGAILADLRDPTKILCRSYYPILEPEKDWEIEGQVPNVVFPCGAVIIKDTLFVYYGGADKVVGVANIKLREILENLIQCKC